MRHIPIQTHIKLLYRQRDELQKQNDSHRFFVGTTIHYMEELLERKRQCCLGCKYYDKHEGGLCCTNSAGLFGAKADDYCSRWIPRRER